LREGTNHHHLMWLNADGTAHVDGEANGLGGGDGRTWSCTRDGNGVGLVGTWNCPGFYSNIITITPDFADDFTPAVDNDFIHVCALPEVGYWCIAELSFYDADSNRVATQPGLASAETEYAVQYAAGMAFNDAWHSRPWHSTPNFCVGPSGEDLSQAHIGSGDGSLNECLATCDANVLCSSVEWYHGGNGDANVRCFHTLGQVTAGGSPAQQWMDALCYIKEDRRDDDGFYCSQDGAPTGW